jgi:hypothetical protein
MKGLHSKLIFSSSVPLLCASRSAPPLHTRARKERIGEVEGALFAFLLERYLLCVP